MVMLFSILIIVMLYSFLQKKDKPVVYQNFSSTRTFAPVPEQKPKEFYDFEDLAAKEQYVELYEKYLELSAC